jgi:hypothetical protein
MPLPLGKRDCMHQWHNGPVPPLTQIKNGGERRPTKIRLSSNADPNGRVPARIGNPVTVWKLISVKDSSPADWFFIES